MIKKERPKIYTKFEIDAVTFYGTMILFIPLILVFTYVFDIETIIDTNLFLIILLIITAVITIIGTIILLIKKDSLKRQVEANYIYEFYYLVTIVVFGILGFVVLFDYLGGNRTYIANILILLVVIFVYILLKLGSKFFNFDYRKKK
ncbi:MAG: hypothetical protein RQ856_01525 [Candidatus Izemoplasmatales bacterium]|nr:hypothetical protein [Candidatus Izemoplasmatales bacterium]